MMTTEEIRALVNHHSQRISVKAGSLGRPTNVMGRRAQEEIIAACDRIKQLVAEGPALAEEE
jgi:hypothetical protein